MNLPAAHVAQSRPGSGRPPDIMEFSSPALRQLRMSGERHLLLDVREPAELECDCIEGHVNIPLGQLTSRLSELDGWQADLVVCICRVGIRSRFAAEYLQQNGFGQVANLTGGILAWMSDAQPEPPFCKWPSEVNADLP